MTNNLTFNLTKDMFPDNLLNMKTTVHNEFEARALIKELLERGENERLSCLRWYTHTGEYLFTTLGNGETRVEGSLK